MYNIFIIRAKLPQTEEGVKTITESVSAARLESDKLGGIYLPFAQSGRGPGVSEGEEEGDLK